MRVNLIGVRRVLVVALTIGLTAVVAGPAQAGAVSLWPTTPPPDRIVIDIVTVNGSGCPANTAAVAVSPDNEAFTVTYSAYMALVGVGSTPIDFRKNCQLNLRVHVPSGFTYAIAQADFRGFQSLERGATSMQRANYYFQGQSQTVFSNHNFRGPFADDWQSTDLVDVAALVYAPCGEERNFNINTELRVAAGTSNPRTTTSFISMDSTDGAINTTYHFSWLRCA
jgi:hypothetical protein